MPKKTPSVAADGFAGYSETHELLERLKRGREALDSAPDPRAEAERLLPLYHRLLHIRDRSFPLLMCDGEPFELDREPVFLYLLPPVGSNPRQRWLLCQYPRTHDRRPKVQVLYWSMEAGGSQLDKMPGCSELDVPPPVSDRDKVPPKLDRRAKSLRVDDLGHVVVIHLELDEGQLHIMANADQGLMSVAWEKWNRVPSPWMARGSTDDKEPALSISRKIGAVWEGDDCLASPEGTPIQAVGIGRVRAVGGTGHQGGPLYLGGSKARLFRLNRETGKIDGRSGMLRGTIHDLVVVPHPERPGGYAILVAASNGVMYLLDDKDGKAEEIVIKCFQKSRHPVVGLFIRDGHYVLARDGHANLIPLRLADVQRFLDECRALTNTLYRNLGVQQRLTECCISGLEPGEQVCLTPDLILYARLALEHFLASYLRASPEFNPEYFSEFCCLLELRYESLSGEALREWALLHLELLHRMWHVMQDECTFDQQTYSSYRALPGGIDQRYFDFLWSLLRLHPRLPDWLMLRMLRSADQVEPWLRHRGFLDAGSPVKGYLDSRLEALNAEVSAARRRMMPAALALRGIAVQGSWRFPGQARHLRVVDEQRHRIAFVEIGFGLRVVELHPEEGSWTELLAARSEELQLSGLITTLSAGTELERVFDGEGGERNHLFLGTDEGELLLLELDWKDRSCRVISPRPPKTAMDIRCCRPIHYGGQAGLLLGGSNTWGGPRLAWFTAHPRSTDRTHILWDGNPDAGLPREGVLRKLVFDQERQGLWALDRDSGLLHHWQVSLGAFRPGKTRTPLQNSSIRLDAPNGLSSLDLGGDDDRLLLCTDDHGMVYALDADSGELRWTVGCGLGVKRVCYLRDWRDCHGQAREGAWLLGGEFSDARLVDNQGTVRGVLEAMGPRR